MAFYVHRSNRTERLVDVLATVVAEPLAHVLAPEWIVISSPGMERWLSMQLAQRVGVWANPAFPFPRKLIDSLLQLADADPGSTPQREGYDPACMTFGIARELAARVELASFAEVERYCRDDLSGRRRMSLAQRLAELFDQYLNYRPDMMLEWASGGGQGFQPELFRALVERHGDGHLARRARRALSALAAGAAGPTLPGWPERIHLFGLSSLPPLYLELLSALSASSAHDLHLYVLSPSREYFADLRPVRGKRKKAAQQQLSFEDPAFQSDTHPLLASLGRHAREFQELLEATTSYRESQHDLYEDPGESCLLHVLQSDLLTLRTRGPDGTEPRYLLAPEDESFAVHACHSPMRELEVLHDQLTRLIAERAVEPSEIIVMTPNISDYTQVIDAVFSQADGQRAPIPFRIADRGPAETQPLLLALAALLDVLSGRFGSNEVLDLLGFDLIRERFGIAVDQLDELRAWLEESGIRWGIDAEHRSEHGQPPSADNTWTQGLQRLTLGYSTGLATDQLFHGCSPAAAANEQGELLGHFLEFCSTLFELRRLLLAPATLPEWVTRMSELARVIFVEDTDAAERKQLLGVLHDLAEHAARAGFEERCDLITLRRLLEHSLSAQQPSHGFLASGVTFCQLLPMRSIPFKVICLIGMNDGVFPASDTPFAFDLMRKQRRLGDRSRKDDDRQLLLEALLSARQQLLISFVGQSQQTGKELPASVLVYELIEQVARSCELPGQAHDLPQLARLAPMEQRLLLRHPLSHASPRYFGADPDPRLFSFSLAGCAAARASQQLGRKQPWGRFAVSKPPLAERPLTLSLRELERCLMTPAREFCQRRLNLFLGDDLSSLPEREPFELDALVRWRLATEWLAHIAQNRPDASRLEVQRARGLLPHFISGERAYDGLQGEVGEIARMLAQYTQGGAPRTVDVDLQVAGIRLTGSIGDIWPGGHVRTQYSQLGRRHELRQFVRQVVLRCLAEAQPGLHLPHESILIGRKKVGEVSRVRFELADSPARILEDLLQLYLAALDAPLPLFQFASRSYAEQVLSKDAEPQAALRSARGKFGDRQGAAAMETDLQDAYVQQLFGDFESMHARAGGDFERAALRLYGPLLAARQDVA